MKYTEILISEEEKNLLKDVLQFRLFRLDDIREINETFSEDMKTEIENYKYLKKGIETFLEKLGD